MPLLVHGDAAFAGQGIVAETLNMSDLKGYTVGGTVHIIANNLLGFTTLYSEEHSSRFSAQLARRQSIPIFHVNAEDVDAVVRVGRLALEYRYTWKGDVVVDLIGYRRHGHSEVDDPTVTQPLLYKAIKDHPPLWEIYAEDIGVEDVQERVTKVREEFEAAQKKAKSIRKKPLLRELPSYWNDYNGGRYKPEYEVDTGLSAGRTQPKSPPSSRRIRRTSTSIPRSRSCWSSGPRWARASAWWITAWLKRWRFGGLVKAGVPVRLTGQDTRRGTFNQRHSVLLDIENEQEYVPLEHIAEGQARCEIYNSTLSEAGVLGFEYGYSRDYPETLVMWEAQFGDFANVAQAVIDQFVSAGEDKWGLLSGVVLLLPHGHEGQGPEHSSARPERFLQLAARDNFQICQPSNAVQYFHLLRRQALRHWRKPLVVFTPKSMLRHPDASSPIEDFTHQRFLTVLPDDGSQRRHPHPDLHRKDRPRIARRTQEEERPGDRDRVGRTVVSVPREGTGSRDRTVSLSAGSCLGAGRAGQHGRAVLCAAAPAPHCRRSCRAVGKAFRQRQPRHRISQGPRSGAEDAADAGLSQQNLEMEGPRPRRSALWNDRAGTVSGAAIPPCLSKKRRDEGGAPMLSTAFLLSRDRPRVVLHSSGPILATCTSRA